MLYYRYIKLKGLEKMKKIFACVLCLLLLLTGCGDSNKKPEFDGVKINFSDKKITVDGSKITNDNTASVYSANDIVFYPEGKDFTYGEGTKDDEHSQSEADAHTVVHITKPGTYVLSGKLSSGQIAVDLGDDAKSDPNAVVTLVLNNADITCTVAPAVIFYNVYECGDKTEENATKDVDTSKAGANVIIADGSVNNVTGSYVARIYDPETVQLNDDKTEVSDADKLHKYDAAFYSKRTMNVSGGEKGDGILNINAQNEGLDSELHLTINGGVINITSGNDGINTNEDNVSVTTVNGGALNIFCNGKTGEGDGIDSNGWLVINGGIITAQACATSGDAGIDSDKGIYINGGKVIASGNMLDRISDGEQTYAVFNFATRQVGDSTYTLKNKEGNAVGEYAPTNDFTYLLIAGDELKEGDYTFWQGDTQLAAMSGGNMGEHPQMQDGTTQPPQMPDGENFDPNQKPQGERPELPNGEMPQGERPELPNGEKPQGERPGFHGRMGNGGMVGGESLTTFTISKGENQFANVGPAPTTQTEE